MRHAVIPAVLAAALTAAAVPASADGTVIEGRSAQALRCAAYIGMAGQYGFSDGRLSATDRAVMAGWSVAVLETWVPLDPARRLEAYGAVLVELGSQRQTQALIRRHSEWCLRAFTPGLL
jgi:hypothetical protein